MYYDVIFKDEDTYEIMKMRKVIRTHVFKHVKLCKGEGNTSRGNLFEKKNVKILPY